MEIIIYHLQHRLYLRSVLIQFLKLLNNWFSFSLSGHCQFANVWNKTFIYFPILFNILSCENRLYICSHSLTFVVAHEGSEYIHKHNINNQSLLVCDCVIKPCCAYDYFFSSVYRVHLNKYKIRMKICTFAVKSAEF
jgi:hypothetical protein